MSKRRSHDWRQDLENLKKYAEELNFPVLMGKEDHCNFTKKHISLNRNRTPRNQVYILAHEIAHVELRSHGEKKFFRRFPGHDCAKNTKRNRVSKVEEEVLAWMEARNILNDHSVPVDEEAFNRVKQICLGTYIF